ncbi:PREDICTED: protein fosB [Nanorana parkeri]|uniref:protein fosB n=1 Tax=Nanorana parkeri TaxID=125878 RepID=UPI00085408FE|nr:PREDICTED: protein fosB [Nanorana parkeri]
MYQGYDSSSSSPSAESQYLSSVDSFGSPPAAAAQQECVALCDAPSSFVPTVTAITSSQDLQWLVTPALISSMAQSQPTPGPSLDPYDLPGPSYASPSRSSFGQSAATPGPEGSRPTRTRKRTREEALTPEEEEKRRVRRERNKLAAAKCRNRRRELTDRLQSETDILEEEKSTLEAEIDELQRQKEQLEFALLSHRSTCKLPYEEPDLPPSDPAVSFPHGGLLPSYPPQLEVSFPVCLPPLPDTDCAIGPGAYTSSFVFTSPEGGACGSRYQRSSGSERSSSDSLSSPSLLAL